MVGGLVLNHRKHASTAETAGCEHLFYLYLY